MKKFASFIISVFVFSCSFGQEIEWQKTIGGTNWDQLNSIQQTSDGGYILGGFSASNISGDKTENSKGSYDYWIVKTDSAGNIQWQKTIGGNNSDYLYSLQQTTDGGYILGGASESNISGDKSENNWDTTVNTFDYWIVKINGLGTIQWENTIGGKADDALTSLQQTSDGGYILGGFSESNISGDKTENSDGLYDYWMVKTDSAGNILWQKTIGGSIFDNLYSLNQTSDGGYLLGGYSNSNISGSKTENSNGGWDYWIVKTDGAGNIQWQNTIDGSDNDFIYSVRQTTDDGYILGGYSGSGISGDKTENNYGYSNYWIVKTDSIGIIEWDKTIGDADEDELRDIQLTNDGGYILAGSTNKIGSVFSHYLIAKTDSTGNIQWQNKIGGAYSEVVHCIEPTSDGGFILGGFSISNISGDKTEDCRGSYDYWIIKLTDKFNSITGKTFIDFNGNQLEDSLDIPIEGQLITESNTNKIAFSEQNGDYSLAVFDSGSFTVTSQITYYIGTPVSHNSSFTALHQTDSLNDFAFQPIAGINDLQITITPFTFFRVNRDAIYMLNYKNVGTTTLTASIVFYLNDTNYTYSSASVAPTLINGDSVVWGNITLTPFQQGSIMITVHVNAGLVIGTQLNAYCIINPIAGDTVPADNYASWKVFVIGSCDPNVKLVSDSTLTSIQLAGSPYLDYIINFQNTGNDTAFNVRVLDNISTDLDLNTFQLVSSSHPFNINYKAHSRLMTFTFDNILLPDSGTNELLSHGFIRYRVKPVSTLAVGDTIKNTAFIYFDFNDPVQTNWAETEIVMPNAVESLSFNNNGLKLFPNPVSNVLNIQRSPLPLKPARAGTDGGTAAQGSIIKIYDVTGRIVYKTNFGFQKSDLQLDVSKLTVGVYVVEITDGERALRGRFLKE
ncbi:MAG: T9SS type A sorting domain-containing protein [Bacteroidia bacterium]